MDNSMDIDLTHRGNNNMNPLSFYWFAEFESFYLKQFDNGIENKFQTVIDKFVELKYFCLRHKDKDMSVTVDLKNGVIFVNKHQMIDNDFITEKKNIRLIYFRRHRHEMNSKMQELNHQITYFIGFQWGDSENRNHKILLQLDSDGNILVGSN